MTQAIEYTVLTQSGDALAGYVLSDGGSNFIQVGQGDRISLHLDRSHVFAMMREGDDLIVILLDGRKVTLDNYFTSGAELFTSSDGELYQVEIEGHGDAPEGAVAVYYAPIDVSGKWSPYDPLIFQDDVILLEPVTGLPAAALPLNAIIGGGVGLGALSLNGSGEAASPTLIKPTVDNPESFTTITTNSENVAASVSGTGEPGSTVTVRLGDQQISTVIDSNGRWDVVFRETTFPSDGEMTSLVSVIAPDGTTYELDGPDFLIDMTPPPVEVTEGAVSSGDVESALEYVDGISIAGTGEPGAAIVVEVRGETQATTVADDGTWSVTFTKEQLPPGTYTEPMKVSATDENGNVAVVDDFLQVDTEVAPLSHATQTPNSVVADGIVNHAEAAGGLVVTGTVEAGSSVTVQLANGTPVQAQVTGTTWTATIPAGSLPSGEYSDVALTVRATDAYGNTASQNAQIDFDTVVRYLSTSSLVGGDNIVNATEADMGFAVAGTAEIGSSVVVGLSNGSQQTTVADAVGKWSVTFHATDLDGLTGSMSYTVTATDPAGNTKVLDDPATQVFTYDFVTPSAPIIIDKVDGGSSTSGIVTSVSEGDGFGISVINENGTITTIQTDDPIPIGTTKELYYFNTEAGVAHGSYLVVTDTDAAGNEASTLLVVNGNSNITLDPVRLGLADFDFAGINMEHSESSLTITEDQILSLTGPENTLILSGDANDSVTALGAQDSGQDTVVGGQTHSIYTVGDDGATLLIDDQISNLII